MRIMNRHIFQNILFLLLAIGCTKEPIKTIQNTLIIQGENVARFKYLPKYAQRRPACRKHIDLLQPGRYSCRRVSTFLQRQQLGRRESSGMGGFPATSCQLFFLPSLVPESPVLLPGWFLMRPALCQSHHKLRRKHSFIFSALVCTYRI